MRKKIVSLVLSLVLLLAALPVGVSAATNFSDVPSGAWYATSINKITQYLPGVISGYPDGTFRPDDNVKRGEFLKMAISAAEQIVTVYTTDKSRNSIHWAGEYYTKALENNIIVSDVYSGGILFPCTYAELEKPITRYEMAVIINNVCTNLLMEKTVVFENASAAITDYDNIDEQYVTAVEQAYGKGIMSGYTGTPGIADGSFIGDNNLRRCEAAKVVYLILWDGDRKMPTGAEYPEVTTVDKPLDFVPFAVQYQSMSDSERRLALFGNANKTYFTSAADAAGYMETVTVPIWTMDKSGNKFASSTSITVHKLVAREVQLIFQEIFDDPERFPIYGGWSLGGSRYTDTMRHSWGCAIDVNAYYNCECTTNWNTGVTRVTCGYGWWPVGTTQTTFAGSMTQASPYSIGANSSVVRAFAKYGWGWGGQGYSLHSDGSQKYDFMHFSILSSGG